MGDPKLFLWVLLCAVVLADANDDTELCLLAKRFKSLHKYEYLYEAESLNFLSGTFNGPKFSCQVEIEVPGTCQYIVHTKECTLSEVVDVDAEGNPVFGQAADSDTFKAEMEKNPLKVMVEPGNDIKLFPEDGELVNILNIKKGIVSALAVPGGQKDTETPTIYGLCKTDYIVDSEEDITIHRDLSSCDQFKIIKGHTSPLAVFANMDTSANELFRSEQTCKYKFDNQMHHMTSAVCTENHLHRPFTSKKYGPVSEGKQTLSFLGVNKYNERVFDYNEANVKTLYMDNPVDMSAAQDKNTILDVLRELVELSQIADGNRRPQLAYKLVSMMRKANADTLSASLVEAMKISPSLMYQALFQCGSQECSSVLMQIIRTRNSAETDAVLYAMGLVPSPTPILINDLLEMAKLKPSKLVYYALSNAIRRRYQIIKKVTPEIKAVADYALEQLDDCTGDQDHTYLTLRVIGNMASAVFAASPALKSAVIQCINQPATSPAAQQAAIQAFRSEEMSKEGRSMLMDVLLDADATVQKRVAAYLLLMKDPQSNELRQLANALPSFENLQVKSFVISHLTNILSSTAKETQKLKRKIRNAFQDNEIGYEMDPTRFSHIFKINNVEGHMIFEKEDKLPKEVILEMTLDAFGYDEETVEVGMESKGLEPTIEALFGSDGFFPDTVLKTIFFATDNMSSKVNEVLNNMIPGLENERKKRQVPKNIIKEITKNVNKLIKNLKAQDTPEAMLYLRVMGAELGYLETKDIAGMVYGVVKIAENLVKMFPTDYIKHLFSNADNGLFLHYIFLDYQYSLPTGIGVPMRFGAHITFTPGVTGGLRITPDLSEIAFLPSFSGEFVCEMGTHLPDYVDSGLELHINLYHESGVRATFTMAKNEITVTFPTANPMELFSVRTYMMATAVGKTKRFGPKMEEKGDKHCRDEFPGVKLCFIAQFADVSPNIERPYFPFSGDNRFAIELHPTYEVSAYTATFKYEFVENTDKVTFVIKPEGTPTKAQVNLMFNRNEYTASAELQVPDSDIEAEVRIGAADPERKGEATHSIQIDLTNKKINQASLVGLAKMETMDDARLQVQLHVPALAAVAKATASVKRDGDLTVELESALKFHTSSSVQKIIVKYDDEKIAAEVKSDVNAKTQEMFGLNTATGQSISDMIASSVEATNKYIKASKIPLVQRLHIPAVPEIKVPENLFLNMETDVKYFYKDYYTVALHMPFSVRSTDLNIPSALATPRLSVPQFGLNIASIRFPLPELSVPKTLLVSLPAPWRTEVAGKISSNLYDLDATASAGRESEEHQSYSGRFKVTGTSPVDLLSIKVEGETIVTGILTGETRVDMSTVVTHKLIETKINHTEEWTINENMNFKSSSRLDTKSPLGLKLSLEHTGQLGFNGDGISVDNNLHGSLVTSPIKGDVTLAQSIAVLSLNPYKPEAKYESLIKVDSTHFQGQNKMEASVSNGELSVVSKTAAFNDRLTHSAGITFMKSKLAMKSDTKTSVLGMKIQNSAEANVGVGEMNIIIETTGSRSEDNINSLVTATVNANGLVVSSDSSVKVARHTASQKASLTLNKNGMGTSGTTLVNSFVTLNNTFSGIIHSSKASLSVDTVGDFGGVTINNANTLSASMSSVVLTSSSKTSFAKHLRHEYDIFVQAEPYSAKADVKNYLKLGSDTELKNTCEMKLADLTGVAKCDTNGKLKGAQLTHETEMEIVGLNIRFKNDARINSQPLRLSNTLQATASPFDFNLHALTNGDGELLLFGKHSGQVFTKLLVKAEPLALAHSHECRLSVTHEFDNHVTFETNFDNKVDTLLTPSEQSGALKIKTKINDYIINQELSTYNTPDKVGVEMSGKLTNGAFTGDQDLSLSAALIYDKTKESNVINLQSLENLPVILENIKMASVNLAEALRDYIRREQLAVKIQNLLQRLSDFINELNIEEQAAQLKQYFIALAPNCPVSTKDLEDAAHKLIIMALNIRAVIDSSVKEVTELVLTGDMSNRIVEKVNELNREYDIQGRLLDLIKAVEDLINRIDINQLRNHEFFNDFELDHIKINLHKLVREIKIDVERFDAATFIEDMKRDINFYQKAISKILTGEIRMIVEYMKELTINLNLVGKCEAFYRNVKVFAERHQLDKTIAELLDKLVDLIKQLKIKKTAQVLLNHLKSVEIPFKPLLDDFITYTKETEIKQIIEDVNKCLEDLIESLKSFEYNAFVDEANQKIREYTTEVNKVVASLELPQKAEATREFLNHALASISSFLQKLKSTNVSEVIKAVYDLIDDVVLKDFKTFARKLWVDLKNVDMKKEIHAIIIEVQDLCSSVLGFVVLGMNEIVDLRKPIDQLIHATYTTELESPSFTVPLTDLVFPSIKFTLLQLRRGEFSTELNLPEFTILGSYPMPAMTISCDYIKEILLNIIGLIVDFKVERFINIPYFEDLSLNFLPDLSAITLPQITIPQIDFPDIPKLSDKFVLDIPLQIPEFELPKIPSEIAVPTFGRLHSEIVFNSPFYTLRTSAEVRNSTDTQQKNHLVVFLSSDGKSPSLAILNYHLDATTRIGIPRMSRVVIAETVKFIHTGLAVEHQASVTLYGLSAQAIAQTTVKATTTPYNAEIFNKAFLAVEGGMTASFDTTYKHQLNVPLISMTSDASLSQKTVIRQKGIQFSVTAEHKGKEKYAVFDFVDEITQTSDLTLNVDPAIAKLAYKSNTDSRTFNIKKTLNAEAAAFKHIIINGTIDTKSPFIKNSLIVASGSADLKKMKLDVGATHDTELVGAVSGKLSNALNFRAHPIDIYVDFQNKANTKVNFQESLAKVDLQNDYAVVLNSKTQHINNAARVRFNQHKYSYNFTVDNNDADAGIYASVNGESDLEFLNVPISIPEMVIPGFNVDIQAINDVNLYEYSGLKTLMTTKPTLDVTAQTVYQKSKLPPIATLGPIEIFAPGKLVSEMSLKSTPFNLDANAIINGEDDVLARINAASTSAFKPLNANLEGHISTKMDKKGLTAKSKAYLKHDDFNVDMNSVVTSSSPSHILNVDITGPNFSDMNVHYAAGMQGLSASVNTPLFGYVGYELHGKKPSQLTSRLYRRDVSDNDIDMLTVNVAAKEKRLRFQADYNLEEHRKIVRNVERTLGFALLAISISARETGVLDLANEVTTTAHDVYTDAYTATVKYATELPDLRAFIVKHQQAIEDALKAIVRFLRDTKVQLPGMEATTLAEICQHVRNNAASMLEQITHKLIESMKACEHLRLVEVRLPWGEVLNADKIIQFFDILFSESVMMIKQHTCLDVILENVSDNVLLYVERAGEFFQKTIVFASDLIRREINWMTSGELERLIESYINMIVNAVYKFANAVSNELPKDSMLDLENGRLRIEVPLSLLY